MKRTFKTEGIVIKRANYGEADRILTFYTKHYGKLRAMAKGVRRLTSRKGGNVELFNDVIIFLVKGKNLDIVTEVQVIDVFKTWRKNLIKVGVAYYFCELVDKLTPEEQPNQQVFRLLKDALGQISKRELRHLVLGFERELLDELGFGVPQELREAKESLKPYIESITEKEINTPRIIREFISSIHENRRV